MTDKLRTLFPFMARTIPPEETTIGVFSCTGRFGYAIDENREITRIYREAFFGNPKNKGAQRGALIFERDVSQFIEGDERQLWRPTNAVLAGPKLLCTFSISAHGLPTDFTETKKTAREELPCALVHSFQTFTPRE